MPKLDEAIQATLTGKLIDLMVEVMKTSPLPKYKMGESDMSDEEVKKAFGEFSMQKLADAGFVTPPSSYSFLTKDVVAPSAGGAARKRSSKPKTSSKPKRQ